MWKHKEHERPDTDWTEISAEIFNFADSLDTEYEEAKFVNIIQGQESNQPNVHSTNDTAAKAAAELNQSNCNSNIKKDGVQHTEATLRESF